LTEDSAVDKRTPGEPEVLDPVSGPTTEIRQRITEVMMGVARGPGHHPIFEKFTAAHVDKFLDHTHQDDQDERHLIRSRRWFQLAYVLIGVASLLLLIVFLLPTDRELLVEILKDVVIFGGGIGSGYGIKSHLERRG
jgi:hypothetical protein